MTSIIKTKYRDIPWEEVCKCLTDTYAAKYSAEKWDAQLRGKPLDVESEPYPERQWENFCCGGPFHWAGSKRSGVCVHIAEIGD